MHQNFPIKFSQFLTDRQRCVESGVVMENDAFPIDHTIDLVAFSRLLGVIFPIVDSRGQNQSFDRATATCSERFLSNLNTHTLTLTHTHTHSHTHTHTHTHTHHNFSRHQFRLCHRLWSFTLLRP